MKLSGFLFRGIPIEEFIDPESHDGEGKILIEMISGLHKENQELRHKETERQLDDYRKDYGVDLRNLPKPKSSGPKFVKVKLW